MYICKINLKPTTMTKEELRGFINGVIEHYNTLEEINPDKYLTFSLYELEKAWLIDFGFLIIDIPSSNLDPADDNSYQKDKIIKLKVNKDESKRNIANVISIALEEINYFKLITNRSEL